MNQKNLVIITLVIVIVIFAGIVGYWALVKEPTPAVIPFTPPPTAENKMKDWGILFAQVAYAKMEVKTFSTEAEYEELIKKNRGFGIEGFKLKYPKDWQIEEKSRGVANILDFKDVIKGYAGNDYIVLTISVAPNQGGLTLEDWSGEVIKQSGFQKTETTSISGFKAFKLEKAESEAGPRYVFFTAERTGGWIFDIQTTALDQEMIGQVFSTFEFIK